MNKKILNLTATVLPPALMLLLTGCWTPPNANVQPAGEPRLIQSGLQVESVKERATVQAVDAGARTITLKLSDDTTSTYKVGEPVKNFGSVQVGDKVTATVTDELAIYLLDNGRLPGGATAETLGVNARVLQVDPSYRLLTLQYPSGRSETVKPGLETKLLEMAPGDSVAVRPVAVTKIKIEKP
jgi:hypothetical protein